MTDTTFAEKMQQADAFPREDQRGDHRGSGWQPGGRGYTAQDGDEPKGRQRRPDVSYRRNKRRR